MLTFTETQLREVAFRIKQRHLRAHLRDWRNTLEKIEVARRSRLKRAKLLRLSRKHGLHHCLEKLQHPGMSIESGSRGPFLTYDCQTTREYLDGLKHQLLEQKTEWEQLRPQPIDPIIANLRTLLETANVVSESPLKVCWVIEQVHLEGIWIGNLEVNLDLEDFGVRVFNLSADLEIRGGYQHPHVNSEGEICWNDYDQMALAFHRSGDFLALRDLIENLLHTYNESSPYINLEDWENGLGESCYECGERYCEDDMYYVEGAGASLCRECSAYCDVCESYVVYNQYDPDWRMCSWCLDDTSFICDGCEGRFNKMNLHTMEVFENDQTRTLDLCETCHIKKKEVEENANCDDTESVLESAMALP